MKTQRFIVIEIMQLVYNRNFIYNKVLIKIIIRSVFNEVKLYKWNNNKNLKIF
jgi:hypothetical protein